MKIQLEAGIEKDDDNDGDNTKLPTGRKKNIKLPTGRKKLICHRGPKIDKQEYDLKHIERGETAGKVRDPNTFAIGSLTPTSVLPAARDRHEPQPDALEERNPATPSRVLTKLLGRRTPRFATPPRTISPALPPPRIWRFPGIQTAVLRRSLLAASTPAPLSRCAATRDAVQLNVVFQNATPIVTRVISFSFLF